jgi:phenylalanyl-tRNA synthetase beta chain
VKEMGKEDTFVTIDQLGRKMLPDDLMIYNQEGPVAIAGVMGGSNSEIRQDTTHLLLESANFNAAKIRRTSVRLGLRTDASARFEKAQPPVNSKLGIARFIHLLRGAGLQPDIKTRLTFEGDLKDRMRYVELSAQKFDRKVGMLIPTDEIERILESMGFEADIQAEALKIGIPPFRSEKDLSIPEDIVEEVARIYGYDDIEPRMPRVEMNPAITNDRLRTEHKARRLLATAHGFLEVHTYSWFDDQWLKTIGLEPAETLVLKNPSAAPQRQMRTTLMPNLLRLVKQNSAHSDYFKVFELGRIYRPADNGKNCLETTNLAGFSFRQTKSFDLESHYRSVKSALEDLAQMCADQPCVFEACEEQLSPWQKPAEYVTIKSNGKLMGHLGLVTDPLLSLLAQNAQVVWFELDFETFASPIYPRVRHIAPPVYPGSWLDFSILWDSAAEFSELQHKLDKFSHPLLRGQKFQYLYKGKGLPEGKASYTFRCWFGLPDRTITTEQIEAFQKEYLDFLKSQNLQLR